MRALISPGVIGLRDVAAGAETVLRGVQFVVRDEHWGTYRLEASPVVQRGPHAVIVQFAGQLGSAHGDLRWKARFILRSGSVEASCHAHSRHGFVTSRTGLVLLHDVPACRGSNVRVVHADGRSTDTAFPDLVAPHQPFHDVAGLEHTTRTGQRVVIACTGEVFETEDQRNWTDASYKTYGRPLSRPYPYAITPGEDVRQFVRMTVTGGSIGAPAVTNAVVRGRAPLPALVEPCGTGPGPFADFNRGIARADVAFAWSSSPTVHAADDDTIGESVEALPDLVATARARSPGQSFRVGPIRLETRFGGREPPHDPRRGTVLEAAWVLGTIAGLLDPVIEALAFHRPEGAAAILLDRLAKWQGGPAETLTWPSRRRVRALGLDGPGGRGLVVAHLAAVRTDIDLPPGDWVRAEQLDQSGFVPISLPRRLVLDGFCLVWLTAR